MRFITCLPQGDQLLNRFFDDDFLSGIAQHELTRPALDIIEEKEQFVLKLDLPGIKKEDIKISLEQDILTIEAKRNEESVTQDQKVHRVERYKGLFKRSLSVGPYVDVSKIQANYKDGVLELIVPKSEKTKPVSIDVKVQ